MKKYIFFISLIIFGWLNLSLSIQEKIPRIEFHFGENVDSVLIEGMDKFKAEYEDKNLSDGSFYLIVENCGLLEDIDFKISYSICTSCGVKKLINGTNRFYKLDEDRFLPIVFDFDLEHSSIFGSADREIRIRKN